APTGATASAAEPARRPGCRLLCPTRRVMLAASSIARLPMFTSSVPSDPRRSRQFLLIRIGTVLLAAWLLVTLALWWWWDYEPARFAVGEAARARSAERARPVVVGTVTTET